MCSPDSGCDVPWHSNPLSHREIALKGIFGELRIVSGRVDETDFHSETMGVRIGEEWLNLPLTVTRRHYAQAGREYDFVVRRGLIFRSNVVARAFRRKGGSNIHGGRTLHYWLGILFGVAVAAILISGCVRGSRCLEPQIHLDKSLWLWLSPLTFVYGILAIIETRQAIACCDASQKASPGNC
jgi:hypothetical protein